MDESRMLREQIKFEQFVNSFYLDFIVNHLIKKDKYSSEIMSLIIELVDKYSTDLQSLNLEMKNLPGRIYTEMKKQEEHDLHKKNVNEDLIIFDKPIKNIDILDNIMP